MIIFLRSFLWSLAAALAVGLVVSFLDAPAVLAQGEEEFEFETGEGTEIQDDPHLYWKCWRTETPTDEGFTNRNISISDLFGSVFATPYLPSLSDGRVDERGLKLMEIGDEKWKRSRGDLIDARFYRSSGLNEFKSADSPTDANLMTSDDQKAFFKASGVALLPDWNPFLNEADARIQDIDIEWSTGSGNTGEAHSDDVDRLQQEQGASATVSEQEIGRAVAYRGNAEPVAGKLSEYAPSNEDPTLAGQNALGARVQYGTKSDQVIDISGTMQTGGDDGVVSSVVTIASVSRDVTNNVSITDRNDPTNPEVFTTSVTQAEDIPRLVIFSGTGWLDDNDLDGHSPADIIALPSAPHPSGFRFAKPAGVPPQLPWARSCFFTMHETGPWDTDFPYREYRFLCWMVRSTSVQSPIVPQPVQSMVVPVSALGGEVMPPVKLEELFPSGDIEPLDLGGGKLQLKDVPLWMESGLAETSDALYYESASKRRGTLAPPEIGDAPDDEIVVSINLKDDFRFDRLTRYTFTDDSGEESSNWHLFGDERVGRRVIPVGDTAYYGGYKQSYMLPPFWGGEDDKILPWMYDHEEPLINHFGMESLVLWPVNLQDMNYYLMVVPGFTKEHAGDRGHVLNLAYAGSPGVHKALNYFLKGFLIFGAYQSIFDNYEGKVGDAVPVPTEVQGTSGRTAIGFNNQFSIASMHLNPFTPGKLYYPFYDVDSYVHGNYPDGFNTDSGTDLLFETEDLLKAGVVSPDDAGEGANQYGSNSRFQWVIKEGAPVLGLEEGNAESVYRQLGLDPDYVSEVEGDPFAATENGSPAWPNSYISPDETHVMILTFYEGRLGSRWKFVPSVFADVQFGQTLYEGANNAVDGAVSGYVSGLRGAMSFVGYDTSKLKDTPNIIPDSGAVPTFQYRRVICRVVIPPEGVVTPATGWTAVTDAVQAAKDYIISEVLRVVGILIAFFEALPGKVMAGVTSVAAESICHGGDLVSRVGGGENDIGTGKDPDTGVDIEINEHEHTDRMSEARCDDARENGLQNISGDCSMVGAAVDDPSCYPVPTIDFLSHSSGLRYRLGWDSSPQIHYDDIWYYSYPGTDEPGPDEAYRDRFSLKAGVTSDSGVPNLTFTFPYSLTGSGLSGTVLNQDTHSAAFGRPLDVGAAFDIAGGVDFDGYVLYVRPDSRIFRYVNCTEWIARDPDDNGCEPAGVPRRNHLPAPPSVLAQQEEFRFILPRYYLRYASTEDVFIGAVRKFEFGGVPLQKGTVDCKSRSIELLKGPAEQYGCGPAGSYDALRSYDFGANKVHFIGESDWERLGFFLDYVWYLGSDSEYSFAISSYRGVPDSGDDWQESPLSSWVNVKGGPGVACLGNHTYWATMWDTSYFDGTNPENITVFGSTAEFELAVKRSAHFNCAEHLAPSGELVAYGEGTPFYRVKRSNYVEASALAEAVFCLGNPGHPRCGVTRLGPGAEEKSIRGVIAGQSVPDLGGVYNSGYLIGSSVCSGIWSGTPSGMTWDSPVVQTIWSLAWVLAMVLLFVLLLWDGLSLTYAGWASEGRGGVTISSMIPRFALALVLASASLFICRIILTLSGDMVCFFIHSTGMTFWNVVGGFILAIFLGVADVLMPVMLIGMGLFALSAIFGPAALLGVVVMAGYLLVMLAALLFVLYYTLKVFATMIVRIVLLMVLIGLGPIAFAMYASPATEHWTKRWIGMLLGTTFQQLAVLITLFIGASLVDSARYDLSLWMQYWQVMFHVLAGMMVLFVASRIPDLVNPQSRGLFSGFTQALAMSGAAAAMIGGGIAGAAAGGAGSSSVGRMASSLRSFAGRIGRGGTDPSDGAGGAGADALKQAGNEDNSAPNPISGSALSGSNDLGVSGTPTTPTSGGTPTMPTAGGASEGDSGGAAGGGGGGAAGGAGFLGSMGRGFMAGASRGTLFGRAMRDMQSGNFFVNDPSTTYQGTSQAQLQGFREYTGGVPFGQTADSRERFERAMERRGRPSGGRGGHYQPDRSTRSDAQPENDIPNENWAGDGDGDGDGDN